MPGGRAPPGARRCPSARSLIPLVAQRPGETGRTSTLRRCGAGEDSPRPEPDPRRRSRPGQAALRRRVRGVHGRRRARRVAVRPLDRPAGVDRRAARRRLGGGGQPPVGDGARRDRHDGDADVGSLDRTPPAPRRDAASGTDDGAGSGARHRRWPRSPARAGGAVPGRHRRRAPAAVAAAGAAGLAGGLRHLPGGPHPHPAGAAAVGGGDHRRRVGGLHPPAGAVLRTPTEADGAPSPPDVRAGLRRAPRRRPGAARRRRHPPSARSSWPRSEPRRPASKSSR